MDNSEARVDVGQNDDYRYPDVTVVSGPLERGRGGRVINPTALFEITSPGTRAVDYGAKIEEYKARPTLKSYLIVDMEEQKIVIYTRKESDWAVSEFREGQIMVPGTGALIDVLELFSASKFE